MIYNNVELHNIEEVRSIQGYDGVRLQRVPEDVRLALNEGAQLRMLQPDSAEIRFVALPAQMLAIIRVSDLEKILPINHS